MTLAELKTAARNLINLQSTDTGATLTDAILTDFLNDAAEDVVLDIWRFDPMRFTTSEQITLIADTANYTLTNTQSLAIWKVEQSISGRSWKEISIVDPISRTFVATEAETNAEPTACYFIGDVIYFVPTPAAASTSYARVWLIVPEAASIAANGPTMIPRVAHRLIAYKAAILAAIADGAPTRDYEIQYAQRLDRVETMMALRYQQEPRFVQTSIQDRVAVDARERVFYDKDRFFD